MLPCLCAFPALAGRPFATEDAGVLEARAAAWRRSVSRSGS